MENSMYISDKAFQLISGLDFFSNRTGTLQFVGAAIVGSTWLASFIVGLYFQKPFVVFPLCFAPYTLIPFVGRILDNSWISMVQSLDQVNVLRLLIILLVLQVLISICMITF
jgi:hypothetical protein